MVTRRATCMPTRTYLLCIVVWQCSHFVTAGPNTLLVSVKHESRRLRNAHIRRIAARSSHAGQECAVNISTLFYLHAEHIETAPGCDRELLCEELLRTHNEIETCEPDFEVKLMGAVNDPYFTNCEQWGLQKIEIEAAWEYSKGSSGNTIVGVMDTGIKLDHPDLKDALWTNPGIVNGVDTDMNGFQMDVHGWDGIDNDGLPDDTGGHGTHCGGIIGATTNNGEGIAGVAGAKIMGLRFIGDGPAGSMSVAQVLLNYAILNGARITGMSFGSAHSSKNTYAIFEYAMRYQHIMVIAAGNEATDNDLVPSYPCSLDLPNIICVGATAQEDQVAYFSNWGKTHVDVWAPGHHIWSTFHNPADSSMMYGVASGTSQAAPHVSGVVALVWDFKPLLKWQEVIDIVVFTADVIPGLVGLSRCGRVNARRAMMAAAQGYIPKVCGEEIPYVSPAGEKAAVKTVVQTVSRHFAVLDGTNCVETLEYGPKQLTESSAPYFSTAYGTELHSKWLQKIMPLGKTSSSDVEITYQFATQMTLPQRMDGIATKGEAVTWTVKTDFDAARKPATTLTKTGTFWFSDNSTLEKPGLFITRLSSPGKSLSSDDGAWGAATGDVNGNCVYDPKRKDRRACPVDFWGISVDHYSSDSKSCNKLFKGDYSKPVAHPAMRVIMTFDTQIKVAGTGAPAPASSSGPISCLPGDSVDGASTSFLSMGVVLVACTLLVQSFH